MVRLSSAIVTTLAVLSGVNAFVAPGTVRSSSIKMMAQIPTKEVWVPVLKTSDIAPGELVPVETDGLQLLVAADLDGAIYAVANVCPHLGTPLDQGTINAQGALVCPLHKSAFSLETGELVGDWCPFPPILGPLILGKLEPQKNLAVFPVRAKGAEIEVLVNRNLKAQMESKYWSGILDAQGKATGDYY